MEHRLQVTEGVLLRLLSQVSEAQLSNAFPKDGAVSHDGGITYMPLARLERRGIDDWSQFPLDSAQNIRGWQHALIGQGKVISGTPPIKADQSPVQASQDGGVKRKFNEASGHHGSISVPSPLSVTSRGVYQQDDQPLPSPVATRPRLDQYWLSFESATQNAPMDERSQFSRALNLLDEPKEPEGVQPVQSNSNWEGAPSANFQQQFLW